MTPLEAITEIVNTYVKSGQDARKLEDHALMIDWKDEASMMDKVATRHFATATHIRLEMKRLAGIDIPWARRA